MKQSDRERALAPYARQQEMILRILRRHGEIDEREFDRIFADFKSVTRPARPEDGELGAVHVEYVKKRGHFGLCAYTTEAAMLGSIYQPGEWAMWLDLMQQMWVLGKVRVKHDGLRTYYCEAIGEDPSDETD